MKKIISFLVASAMVLSASITAFAITEYPDGYAPKADISLVKDAGPDADGYYDYTMTIDLKDLGTLDHTKDGRKYSGIKLASLSIDLRGAKSMDIAKDSVEGNIGGATTLANVKTYTGSDASGINIVYYANEVGEAYPTTEGTATDCNGAIVLKFYSMEGTITLSNATVNYLTFENSAIKEGYELSEAPLTLLQSSFTIGETTPEPATLGLTADLIGHYDDRGYIWNANVTKGENEISSFGVEFSAGGDTKTGSIANISALTNKYTGAEFTFQVGLKTTKTLDSATFSIADGGDPITADAPVSK